MTSLFEYGRVESPCLILLLRNSSKSDRTCISNLVALLGGKRKEENLITAHTYKDINWSLWRKKKRFRPVYEVGLSLDSFQFRWLVIENCQILLDIYSSSKMFSLGNRLFLVHQHPEPPPLPPQITKEPKSFPTISINVKPGLSLTSTNALRSLLPGTLLTRQGDQTLSREHPWFPRCLLS